MIILCIGDSNTYGYDPRSCFGGRYPAEIRWTDRLNGVINSGLNGLSVPSDASDFIDLIKSTKPDWVTVMLGVNDLLLGASADVTASRMETFVTKLKEALARIEVQTRILLIAPPPVQRGEWVTSDRIIAESKKLGKLYRELAHKTDVYFTDAGAWNVELTFDGVHFSEAGHAAFAIGLAKAFNETAGRPLTSN